MLKDFLRVMEPSENVVIYDRFNRKIECCASKDVSEYLTRCDVDLMWYTNFEKCIAFKLNVGMFE